MGLNHTEALDKIDKIAKKDSPLYVVKKELTDVLNATDENSYQQVLDGVVSSYDKATGYVEKRNLQFASPFINSYIEGKNESQYEDKVDNGDKSMGIVTLIRESDSTGKYKVYKYQVKNGGYPKDIIRQYKNQIGGGVDGMKITDSKGKEYGESTKFTKGENVYIKVPKEKSMDYLDGLDESIKEKIQIQEDYIKMQSGNQKEILDKFDKISPMGKDVEFSFGIPVKEYEDIDKTLSSITEKQTLSPNKYEIVLLLNRPNKKTDFDKKTKEKILKFKLDHPEYNIALFEHTFDFKDKAKMGEIYKLLGDTIVYRNIQRKKIKGMDMKKIRNLIMKTGGADSTDKNPDYLQNQIDKYSKDYNGKELIRLTGESRIPAELAKTYPLLEIDEFFQRYYDLQYVGGDPLKRDVGIGTYRAWGYGAIGGFEGNKYVQEDTGIVKKIKGYVATDPKCCMHHDSDFVGAVDNSTDRGICSIVHGIPYCDRYNTGSFKGQDDTKKIERNKRAIQNKGKPETACLELTTKNLGRDISALYRQKFQKVYKTPAFSRKYTAYLSANKNASDKEKKERLLNNVINPVMETVLLKPDFLGLDKNDYELSMNSKGDPEIKFKESAITKIQQVQQQKIKNGYYDYRK